jgi:hypothetical protein
MEQPEVDLKHTYRKLRAVQTTGKSGVGRVVSNSYPLYTTYQLRKGGSIYYAFFAPRWQGQLELRGLKEQSYRIFDYENGKDLGRVNGPAAMVSVEFQKHFLLEARPE